MPTYQEFKKDFDKKQYYATHDETKRLVSHTQSGQIFAGYKFLFNKIINIMCKLNHEENNIFIGQVIGSQKKESFISEYDPHKVFEVMWKTAHQFHIYTYRIKPLSDNLSKLTFTHTVKHPTRINGLSGLLITIKFKKEHRSQTKILINYFNKVLQPSA